jgi:HSP20 family protein
MNTLTPFRSLFPTTSENMFSRLDAPIDRLWRRLVQMESLNNESFNPAANVIEKVDSYVVKIELPGIPREDIHVTLQDNILTIRGEKKSEKTCDTDSCRCNEVSYGTFERSMSLPNVAEQDVDAQLHAGVLTITVKKRKEARSKEIPVKGS